jgi:hypothetical protein
MNISNQLPDDRLGHHPGYPLAPASRWSEAPQRITTVKKATSRNGWFGKECFLLEQKHYKGSRSLKHGLFRRQLWKPVLPREVLTAHVDTVCISLSPACLLPAFLYTANELASA